MGLPWRGPVVPLMAVAEVVTGAAVVVTGARPALVVLALWYAGFVGFVAVALRREVPLASCGCLGREDTPPTAAHLLVNIVFAVAAAVAAVSPFGAVDAVLADQPGAGVPLLLWVAVGVYVTYLVLAVLPITLVAAARPRDVRIGGLR